MSQHSSSVTGRLQYSSAGSECVSGSGTTPMSGSPRSGAVDPTTSATPSNQRGRQTFSGRTAAACDGKVAGMPATLATGCGASVVKLSELRELLRHQLVRGSQVDLVALLSHRHHEHHVTLDADADDAHVPLGVLLRVGVRLGTRYADDRAGVARRVTGPGGVQVVPEE